MTVLNASRLQFIVLSILQPSFLAVLHLVVQTQVARNETNFLFVSVILVTVVTDSTVQVGLLYKNQTCLHLFSIVPFGFSVGRGQGDIRAKIREIMHRWGTFCWEISVSHKVLLIKVKIPES